MNIWPSKIQIKPCGPSLTIEQKHGVSVVRGTVVLWHYASCVQCIFKRSTACWGASSMGAACWIKSRCRTNWTNLGIACRLTSRSIWWFFYSRCLLCPCSDAFQELCTTCIWMQPAVYATHYAASCGHKMGWRGTGRSSLVGWDVCLHMRRYIWAHRNWFPDSIWFDCVHWL